VPSGPANTQPQSKPVPTQPKGNKVTPAVPITVNQKSFIPPAPVTTEAPTNGAAKSITKPVPSQAAMDEATIKAKEAVAAALAKLPQASNSQKPVPTAASIDALSKRMGEMATTSNGTTRGRGGFRGRGSYTRSGSGGHASKKIEIPRSDYDFESANAKFNKEDLIKEAIATGSPAADADDEGANDSGLDASAEGLKRKDSIPLATTKAYNKSSSFFDNLSSETKDREDNQDARTHARQQRGEEFKRNVETFGQGNIDGGYRGRGRGRGFSHGRPYGGTYRGGYNRGPGGGFNRGRGRGGAQGPTPASAAES
jgi:protein LSM14